MKASFGECLSALLKIFDMKGSKLAKGINIDQSLVYKWLRGERFPAYDSNYIDLISDYLSESLHANPHIKDRIAVLFPDKEGSSADFDFRLEFRTMLRQAQTRSYDIKDSREEGFAGYGAKTGISRSGLHGEDDIGKVRLVSDVKTLFESMLELLGKASQKAPGKKPVLILLNSNMAFLDQYGGVSLRWKTALLDAMRKGWEVILLIRLNDNIKRTMKLVEDILTALFTDRFRVYYIDAKRESDVGNDLIIVPDVGALFSFSSRIKDQVDSAFLFESAESIEALTGHFYQFVSMAKPFFVAYPSQKYVEFQKTLAIAEARPGERLVFKGGHSTIIVPSDLYRKYLKHTVKNEDEISRRLDLHNKRMEAFESQIQLYRFREIWLKESFLRLIFEKEKEQYVLGNYIPEKEETILYLQAIIGMLRDYENYEVALMSKNDYPDISRISWMVKGGSKVFLEVVNDMKSEINLVTAEGNLVAAFRQYFLNLWNDIPQLDKDKLRVIDWFHSLIQQIG